ncbi:MAG: prepilin-type N-terminal cleavage/methylation domain-containing protein [Burkholderiaceae bacterium]|nr:prepilin-type N-terminal cleavage/methylation domain-containing protein [Burkholderiaceae bacterium]
MRRAASGFTLVELLIAISLMAVLAVLGWRGLDSVLSSRERIVDASDSLRALSVAFHQIDEDLRLSWPVRLRKLSVVPIGFGAAQGGASADLQLVREQASELAPAQLQRVIYRVRAGVLERGFAQWVSAGPDAPDAPGARDYTWQPLLSGVSALQMRGWIDGQGWIAAATIAARSGAATPQGLVTGVEVLVARGDERVLRVFTVKD